MPGQQTRGDEPSMYLQRPSTSKSQDVRHILVKTFRELFTRDAIGPETVKNLKVSKGGDDPYHERYVDALQKVYIFLSIFIYLNLFSSLFGTHKMYENSCSFKS